jgi:hypothetical protein
MQKVNIYDADKTVILQKYKNTKKLKIQKYKKIKIKIKIIKYNADILGYNLIIFYLFF